MEIDQFRQIAIQSSRQYFAYLDKNGKGVSEVNIIEIRISGDLVKLRLDRKLYDTDNYSYKIRGFDYTVEQIPQLMYDVDNNILTITPKPNYVGLFIDLDIKEIKIISDLKFLVKRVEDWYTEYGSTIKLPQIKNRIDKNVSFNNMQTLSEEQKKAVTNVITSPLSYIWGAPGTGKTRYVLSNCIVCYVRSGKKAAVFAPTNNAIEQVLYGVLEILKQNNIETNKILRLGTPSQKFAQDYPEVCENVGLQKKIEEVESLIKFYEAAKRTKQAKENYKMLIDEVMPLLDNIEKNLIKRKKIIDSLEHVVSEISSKKILIYEKQKEISCCIKELNTIEHSLSSKFIKVFQKRKAALLEKERKKLILDLKKDNNEIDQYRRNMNRLNSEQYRLNHILSYNVIGKLIKKVREKSCFSNTLTQIVSNLNESNYYDTLSNIYDKKYEMEEYCSKNEVMYADLMDFANEEIDKKLDDIKAERDSLYKGSTQKRMSEALVVAGTVDTFLFRFEFNNKLRQRLTLKVDHIFLDEAGYCNLIKGTALLAANCPVSFFGDHFQLPPVCEMNINVIGEDSNHIIFLWAQSVLHIEELFTKNLDELLRIFLDAHLPDFHSINKSELTATYRFGNKLSYILDKYVYKNGFRSASVDNKFQIEVVNAPATVGKKKRENPAEAEAIKKYIECIKNDDFVILSPYKDQVSLIEKYLPNIQRQQRIMTIHRSQGREWDIVILSVSDTGNMYYTNTVNSA